MTSPVVMEAGITRREEGEGIVRELVRAWYVRPEVSWSLVAESWRVKSSKLGVGLVSSGLVSMLRKVMERKLSG